MLPLRDDIPSSRVPIVTVTLISLNAIVFIQELRLGPHLEDVLYSWALIPARYTGGDDASLAGLALPFFSSMFLHGGWIHLIGNMWTLWIFGDNVEDRLGHGKFLLLYLFSGIARDRLSGLVASAAVLQRRNESRRAR